MPEARRTRRRRKADSNPWSRYMANAFETILVAWLAFAFLPERPTRSQGGTDGSNPLSSSGESVSLPELLSRVENPGFPRGCARLAWATGSAETRRVFQDRAN